MLTHRNCYINAYNLIAHLRRRATRTSSCGRCRCSTANGWGGPFALTAMGGRTSSCARSTRADIYQLIEQEGVTFACMAPAVLRTILDYPDKAKHDDPHAAALHGRRRAAAGGVHRAAREGARLGVHPDLRAHRDRADPHRLDARLPHAEGRLARAARARASRRSASTSRCSTTTGSRCRRDGERSARCARARTSSSKGYWEQPEETAKAIHDGYFHTGDLGGLGRVRQHPHRRPQEGRDHLGRREHQLARDRGRALPAPRGARVRGDRRAAREVGRDAEGAGRAAAGHDGDGGRAHRVLPRAPGALQVPDLGRASSTRCRARRPASCRSSCCASKYWKGATRRVN